MKWLAGFLTAIVLSWAGWISNSVVKVYHLPEKVDKIETNVDTMRQNITKVREDITEMRGDIKLLLEKQD